MKSIIVDLENKDPKVYDLLSNDGLQIESGFYYGLPPRNGSVIAAIAWDDIKIHLILLDYSTKKSLLEPSILTFNKTWERPLIFWDVDVREESIQTLIVKESENITEHTRIGADGSVNVTSAKIVCTPYPTSSGRIRVEDGSSILVNTALNDIETFNLEVWNDCTSIYEL